MSVTLIKPSQGSEGADGNFFPPNWYFLVLSLSLFFLLPLPLFLPLNLHGGGGVAGKGRVVLVVLNLSQLDFLPSSSVSNLKVGS